MKGNEQVIGVLNQVLRKELTGINQYTSFMPRCVKTGDTSDSTRFFGTNRWVK